MNKSLGCTSSALVGLSLLLILAFALSLSFPAQAAPVAQYTVFPTPTPGPDGRIIYIVQANDTLWRISAITGVSIDDLRRLNNLTPEQLIHEGDQLLIGLAGPAILTPTPGPAPTPTSNLPSPTSPPGFGTLCVLLYEDVNGDSLREETEPSLPRGAISVGDRLGKVSLTAETPSGGISDKVYPDPQDVGYTCFDQLPEGEYNITVAVPEGYNPTTVLNRTLGLKAGDETLIAFGAQANEETVVETAIIPETPGKSPILGILGGLFLLVGAGLGVYAVLLRRSTRKVEK
jgi:hypothetical protein